MAKMSTLGGAESSVGMLWWPEANGREKRMVMTDEVLLKAMLALEIVREESSTGAPM